MSVEVQIKNKGCWNLRTCLQWAIAFADLFFKCLASLSVNNTIEINGTQVTSRSLMLTFTVNRPKLLSHGVYGSLDCVHSNILMRVPHGVQESWQFCECVDCVWPWSLTYILIYPDVILFPQADADGNVVRKDVPGETQPTTFSYDDKGYIVEAENNVGRIELEYTDRGLPQTVTYHNGGTTRQLVYMYDDYNRRTGALPF